MKEHQKKIMILGAGNAQLHLIKASIELGYEVIVCDMRPETEGAKLADRFYQIDYMDRVAILDVAQKERVHGVISNSEPAMLNVAYLSETLGLPGNSMKSIETLLSKTKFRALQEEVGAFAPAFAVAASEEELLNAMKGMNYPIIIKPNESSGTRGTTKFYQFDERSARETFKICQEFSRNDLVSVEEYVEMSCLRVNDADVFVFGDEILWDGWLWEDRSKDAPMLPMTEIFPMALPEKHKQAIQDVVNRILRASGVRLGEYNVETYDTPDGDIFVIEINPRQAGNYIPQLIEEHTGVSLTKLLVSTAVGDMSYYNFLKTYQRENRYITCQVVFSKEDGIYEELYIDPAIEPYVKWKDICIHKGDAVVTGCNAAQALAFVDLEFDSFETQHQFTDEIERYIHVILRK